MEVTTATCVICGAGIGELILRCDASTADVWTRQITPPPKIGPSAEPEVHADLGTAYLELGLVGDALYEAGAVLGSGDASKAALLALRIIVDDRVARPDTLARLRKTLFRS